MAPVYNLSYLGGSKIKASLSIPVRPYLKILNKKRLVLYSSGVGFYSVCKVPSSILSTLKTRARGCEESYCCGRVGA